MRHGYSANEFREMTVTELLSGTSVSQLQGNYASCEAHIRHKEGSVFPAHVVSFALPGGAPTTRLLMATECLSSEQGGYGSDSARLIDAAWEYAPLPMRVTDCEGTVVRVNEAYCRLAATARADLERHPGTRLFAEGERAAQRALYRERFDTRKLDLRTRGNVTLRDGRHVWLESSDFFVEIDRGTHMLTVFSDVTKQHQAEEHLMESRRALEDSEARLKTMMNNLPGMAYRCSSDPNWTMQFIGDGCYDLTG